MTSLDETIEGLYDLEPHELRRLALEALLISDGPNKWKGKPDPQEVLKPDKLTEE